VSVLKGLTQELIKQTLLPKGSTPKGNDRRHSQSQGWESEFLLEYNIVPEIWRKRIANTCISDGPLKNSKKTAEFCKKRQNEGKKIPQMKKSSHFPGTNKAIRG